MVHRQRRIHSNLAGVCKCSSNANKQNQSSSLSFLFDFIHSMHSHLHSDSHRNMWKHLKNKVVSYKNWSIKWIPWNINKRLRTLSCYSMHKSGTNTIDRLFLEFFSKDSSTMKEKKSTFHFQTFFNRIRLWCIGLLRKKSFNRYQIFIFHIIHEYWIWNESLQ